ncbi:rhodanese-like domain-containing protein [Tamlana sp. I1]|uniref:rhodanese-like domain-containing protein n=1 Tax=Tamlana sp. I1 TaxID=2762061 RepID=UPI0018907AD7|nr:rhodanese-like domain-containing protein [Tamlana sp. I1]
MKTYILTFCAALMLTFFSCNQLASQDGYSDLDAQAFNKAVAEDSMLLIDVRTPKEFEAGHLKNALNIDFLADDFAENIKKLNSEKPVYIYCRSGKRSKKSVEIFQKAGFTQIYNLDSGFLGWKSENLPIVFED